MGWLLHPPSQLRFNPRTYTRCDETNSSIFCLAILFQSTHLHEVRHFDVKYSFSGSVFQSTHLHEVRLQRNAVELWLYPVSIHAPTRGATSCFKRYSDSLKFQSTHLHEVRLLRQGASKRHRCFNPRTYTRCDVSSQSFSRTINEFQSTHLHEVRLLLVEFQ